MEGSGVSLWGGYSDGESAEKSEESSSSSGSSLSKSSRASLNSEDLKGSPLEGKDGSESRVITGMGEREGDLNEGTGEGKGDG